MGTAAAKDIASQAVGSPAAGEVVTDKRRPIMVLPLRHRREIVVMMDNGWARHHFRNRQAFVDASIGYMFERLGEAELAKVFFSPRVLSGKAPIEGSP